MRSIRTFLLAACATTAAVAGGTIAVPAHATEGPELTVDATTLAAALSCPATFAHSEHEPVLLVHGTSSTATESWNATYLPALRADGFDVCTVQLPDRALGDIQIAAEYVVAAVRTIHSETDTKVDIIGHSQGGLEPRWAVKWWPDVRADVDDLVMLATPNHGASGADTLCPTSCAPAVQQQKSASNFLRALNAADETPGSIDYSALYSLTDELVQPAVPVPTAALDGASNVLVQDLCPGRPVHHVGMVYDAVVYGLVVRALANPGPVDTARFDVATCASTWPPAMDPVQANVGVYVPAYVAFATYAHSVDREPPLQPYAE